MFFAISRTSVMVRNRIYFVVSLKKMQIVKKFQKNMVKVDFLSTRSKLYCTLK